MVNASAPRVARVLIVALLCGAIFAPLMRFQAHAMTTNLRWGYYVSYDSTSLTTLKQHVGQLDIVAPYFYNLKSDGTIDSQVETAALTVMQGAHVKIVPMIKNNSQWDAFHTTIATAAQRDAIAQRISDLVINNSYDGINLDFEGVNATDSALLTDLVQRISTRLRPQGKLVTQAVIARTSDAPTTWGGAYDYTALSKLDDYILVMAYDFHYAGGTPGAVAPIGWITDVVTYV
jgi:spore germination protein